MNIQHQIDLSRKTTLLVSISNEFLGFDSITESYASDKDFGNIWMELETMQHRGFSPFEVVYETSPRRMVDLVDLPGKKNVQANRMVEEVQDTYEDMMTSLSNKYEKLKKIPKDVGLDESLHLIEQDPSLPRRKREAMKLENETYITGLHCHKEIPEGVKILSLSGLSLIILLINILNLSEGQ
nr:transposon Ty3-I Gag-Pol polyprotein [Tanacetum cinerariifolium]